MNVHTSHRQFGAKRLKQLQQITLLMLLAICCGVPSLATPPDAESVISNRAEAVYYHEVLAGFETVFSNTTQVIVDPVIAASVEPDQERRGVPGYTVALPHQLQNTGNTTADFVVNYANDVGDDFDLFSVKVVVDLNNDGVFNPTEPVILPGGTWPLAAGAFTNILVLGTIPGIVPDNAVAAVTLEISDAAGTVLDSVTDRVTTELDASAILQTNKTASASTATPGNILEYRLRGTNVGISALQTISVLIDGASADKVIVRDTIPRGATFNAFTLPGISEPLYHRFGAAEHQYQSVPPTDPGLIDAVAFAFDELPASRSFEVAFSVRVNDNAGGDIRNTAVTHFDNGMSRETVATNEVITTLPAAAATLNHFQNNDLGDQPMVANVGDLLNLVANASACNLDPLVIESYPLTITAALSGDQETDTMIVETGPNTGIFVITSITTTQWPTFPTITDNGSLEVGQNDIVTTRLESCPGVTLETRILIDPAGIVFDPRTNLPVEGATVTLIGINPDGSEFVPTVLAVDGSPLPNQVITGADGVYEFPLVDPGQYRIDILPPNGYHFPSDFPITLLAPNRRIDRVGSYGGVFEVSAVTGPVFLDIPIDPDFLSGLFIEKTASRTTAGIGDVIRYNVRIKNNTGIDIFDISVDDVLPTGFGYLEGTTALDGTAQPEPLGAPGPALKFFVGYVEAGDETLLSYRLQIRTGALGGDGINTAQAFSTDAISNVSAATVKVSDDIFNPEGIIAGKVFVDCNLNRLQDKEDLGIPGVRIYLEDGTWVISDAEGKYSFAGVRATTHILKLDTTTLPSGAELTTLSNRNAGTGDSQFVDLKRGDLHRADFAEGSCTPEIMQQVTTRRTNGEVFVAETEQRLGEALRTENQELRIDPRSRPSSGVLGGDGRIKEYKPLVELQRPTELQSNLPGTPQNVGTDLNLEELIKGMDSDLGFVDLKDGDTLASDQVSVRVKGATDTVLALAVNGELVDDNRIGQRTVMADTGVQAWEYVAVRLTPGTNELLLTQTDPFGNVRDTRSIKVLAPGRLGRLVIELAGNGAASADGRTPVPVIVRLTDDRGVRVSARTPVTLETTLGWWDVKDLDPVEPGLQAFIEGGDALFDLLPPDVPGTADIRATSGVLNDQRSLDFLPELRPLIVAGVIDGAIGTNKLNEDELTSAAKNDGFEEQIGGFSFTGKDGDQAGGRAALFLKGKVRGDYLLTLSYDSDKDLKDRLFRDIRPDEFYAVYGDSSVKGFDAQSTGSLFVRIDKGRSFMLYGDYTTQSNLEARKLGNYNRSLNGAKYHFENDRASINIFASYDDNIRRVREIAARGVSGPYALDDSSLLINSEQVEIITRDRNQPSVILDTRVMTRFTDYSLDPLTGSILFRQPVASFDANLNPNFVRVTFESQANVSSYWQYGFDGQVRLTDRLELGVSAVRDELPGEKYELYSANVTVRLTERSHLIAETAHSESETGTSGDAHRIEVRHEGEKLSGRIYGYRSDGEFDNPNASVSPGRNEAGAKAAWRVSDKTQILGEYIYTEDRSNSGSRRGALLSVEQNLGSDLRAQIGVRHSDESAAPALEGSEGTTPRETTSVRVRADWQMPMIDGISVYTEYEQDTSDSERKTAAVGGEYQLADRGRAYLRHEFISSLTGVYGLSELAQRNHNTVFGFDFDYLENQNLFSEYRVRDAISGREAEAAFGLRNSWTVREGLRLNGSFERVQPVSGNGNETTAVTGAFEYTGNELWKGTGRLELRQSPDDRAMLNTVGLARKLTREWTFLAQNALNVRETRSTGDRIFDDRLRLGFAFRDNDTNRVNALARYEFKYEHDEATGEKRAAHIWSANVNHKPTRPLTLSGRYAGKWVRQRGVNLRNDFSAHMLSGRVTYDITERWDIGVHASTLFDGDLDSNRYAAGIEGGVLVRSNLWLSAGYNFFGYEDNDFGNDEYTNNGVYMRFRFKFSEDMFEWLK